MISRLRLCLLAIALPTSLATARPAQAGDYPLPVPVVRAAMGPAVHFGDADGTSVHYALDATVGITVLGGGVNDSIGYFLNGELGYALDTYGVHAFTFGPRVGFGTAFAALAYHPTLLAGTGEGHGAVGMRNALSGHFLLDIFTIEAGHQFLHFDRSLHHDVHVLAGVNLAAPFFFLALLGSRR